MIASILWDVDPVLGKFGPFVLRWYGLMWALGFILAYKLAENLFRKENYPEGWIDKLFLYSFVSVIIGARLGHCLFYEWDYYTSNPIEILKVWKGGLASHGGTLGVILALMIFSKKITQKNVWWLFDRLIPSVAILCFCIRFGNLMNSEIFGYPTTMPWGFEFVRSREWHRMGELPCHPTQIYEMMYCFAAGIISWLMYHKWNMQKRVGMITGVALIIFFGTRIALEFMKNPQVEQELQMTFNIGQLLSVPLVLLGVYLICTSGKRKETWPVFC